MKSKAMTYFDEVNLTWWERLQLIWDRQEKLPSTIRTGAMRKHLDRVISSEAYRQNTIATDEWPQRYERECGG